MKQDELRVVILTFRKDALLEQYRVDIGRWHAVEGVAIGSLSLGVLGFVSGTVSPQAMALLAVLGTSVIGAANHAVGERQRRFTSDFASIVKELKRLKVPEAA